MGVGGPRHGESQQGEGEEVAWDRRQCPVQPACPLGGSGAEWEKQVEAEGHLGLAF